MQVYGAVPAITVFEAPAKERSVAALPAGPRNAHALQRAPVVAHSLVREDRIRGRGHRGARGTKRRCDDDGGQ